METFYEYLEKHKYPKGIPTVYMINDKTSEIKQITINTHLQLRYKPLAKRKLYAIACAMISDNPGYRVTCFHINYPDGVELVFTPSFYTT